MADGFGPWILWTGGEPPREGLVQRCFEDEGAGIFVPAKSIDDDWSGVIAYRVKREPMVETTRQGRMMATATGVYYHMPGLARTCPEAIFGTVVFETRDGIPDMTTLRWEDSE